MHPRWGTSPSHESIHNHEYIHTLSGPSNFWVVGGSPRTQRKPVWIQKQQNTEVRRENAISELSVLTTEPPAFCTDNFIMTA